MTWHDNVRTGLAWPVSIGVLALTLGFGGFGAWAAMAPLEGAVIASGTVTALGRNNLIQHLEGGIIKDILVREGASVAHGQALFVMDGTPAEALRNRIRSELSILAALEMRAEAERGGAEKLDGSPPASDAPATAEVKTAIADQQNEFNARLDRHKAEMAILNEQIEALQEEIAGIEHQQQAVQVQLELTVESKNDLELLFEKNLVEKSRVLELRAQEADLTGQAGQLAAASAKAKQMIAEKQQEQQRLAHARLEEASKTLAEIRGQRADLLEQLRAAEDTLSRTIVTAPAAGTVTNLAQLQYGSVISPGQRLLEIVPDQAELIVEAHIRPQDISQIHLGQHARLAFTALDPRQTPQVDGRVSYVSADRLENERTGETYYLARLDISSAPLEGFDPQDVGAGQPVEVYITTGERTFLAYVIDPLAKTVTRSLRED